MSPVRARAALAAWGPLRRIPLALALGAAAALAMPPFHAVYLLPVCFVGLIWLAESAPHRRAAFAVGWWFGFGHFCAGLYWVANAFMVEAELYGALAPFAVMGLSIYLALFPAAAALAVWGRGGCPWAAPLALAGAWALGEWLRGWLFTGFPWNPLGSVWAFSDAMLQPAAWVGVFGLSLITAFAAAALAALGTGPVTKGRAAPAAVATLLLLGLWGAGALRLADAPAGDVAGVKLRIVQGNIPQKIKWQRNLREAHLASYLALSGLYGGGATHVIWPETAVPFALNSDTRHREAAASAAPPGGALITGSVRTGTQAAPGVWNSVLAIDQSARLIATYDKAHLVPFGEYVPLRGLLPFGKLTEGRGDFSSGPGPRSVTVPGAPPFSPLICYEAIFPAAVVGPGPRPRWLLNVTNDAWFGLSTGPRQHLVAARLRAVEEGLPLVRAANTGISAVIDANGRVRGRLGLDVKGVLDAPLPAAYDGPTVFGLTGRWLTPVLALGVLLSGFLAGRERAAG
jgi:apolipoprotein N-acyltransferase